MTSSVLFPGGSAAGLPALFGGSAPTPAMPVPAPAPDPLSVPVTPTPAAAMPSSWDVLGHMAQGKSLPDAYAAAQAQAQSSSALPAPPPMPAQTNRAGDVLDSLFLDGAFRKTREANYAKQVEGYQLAMQRAGLQRQYDAVNGIQDPTARLAATLDPTDFVKEGVAKQYAPQSVAGGSTLMTRDIMGGPSLASTAPLLGVDTTSGDATTQTPNSLTVTGRMGGGYSVDPSGNVISSRTGATGVSVPEFHSTPVTDNASLVSPTAGGPPAGAPMLGASGGGGQARGVRNNNLANVKALPNGAMWRGQTGADANGYAIFDSAANGQRAAMRNMASYGRKDGVNTVNGFVERWASDSSPADKANYKATLASALGVSPDAKIDLTNPQTQATIYKAQIPIESPGGAPQGGAAPSGGSQVRMLQQGKKYTIDPATGLQTAPNGEVSAGPTMLKPTDAVEMGKSVMTDPSYRDARESSAAFAAMKSLAAQPQGGMRAYALRDTFARTINPGAVARAGTIEAIKQSQGIPANVQAYFSNLKGDGDVPPAIVKQILAAAAPFAQSHWDDANQLNQHFAGIAKSHNLDPTLATAPLGARPALDGGSGSKQLTPQQAAALPPGTRFQGTDGKWRVRH